MLVDFEQAFDGVKCHFFLLNTGRIKRQGGPLSTLPFK